LQQTRTGEEGRGSGARAKGLSGFRGGYWGSRGGGEKKGEGKRKRREKGRRKSDGEIRGQIRGKRICLTAHSPCCLCYCIARPVLCTFADAKGEKESRDREAFIRKGLKKRTIDRYNGNSHLWPTFAGGKGSRNYLTMLLEVTKGDALASWTTRARRLRCCPACGATS